MLEKAAPSEVSLEEKGHCERGQKEEAGSGPLLEGKMGTQPGGRAA